MLPIKRQDPIFSRAHSMHVVIPPRVVSVKLSTWSRLLLAGLLCCSVGNSQQGKIGVHVMDQRTW